MKKRGCLFVVAGAFLLVAVLFLMQSPGNRFSSEKVVIGADTTVLDGPLYQSGGVDYLAALNQRLSRDLNPDDNAVVALLRVLGGKARDLPGQDFWKRYSSQLGIDEITVEQPLMEVEDYVRGKREGDTVDHEALGKINLAVIRELRQTRQPWNSAALPDEWSEYLKEYGPVALYFENLAK